MFSFSHPVFLYFLLISNSLSSSFLLPSLLSLVHIDSLGDFLNEITCLLISHHGAASPRSTISDISFVFTLSAALISLEAFLCGLQSCSASVLLSSHKISPPSFCFSHSPGPLLAISHLELSPQGWLPDPPSSLASHFGSGSIIGLGIDSSPRGCHRCLPHCSGWMLDLDGSAFLSFIPGHSPIHLIYDDSLSDSFFLFHHYGHDSSCCHLLPEQWGEASASLHSILLCSLLLVILGKPRPGAEEMP